MRILAAVLLMQLAAYRMHVQSNGDNTVAFRPRLLTFPAPHLPPGPAHHPGVRRQRALPAGATEAAVAQRRVELRFQRRMVVSFGYHVRRIMQVDMVRGYTCSSNELT